MRGHETFRNAPIVEATIDLTARHRPVLKVADLDRYGALGASAFPKHDRRRPLVTSLTTGEDSPGLKSSRSDVVEFRSDDDKYIAQVRRDGFAFTRLSPYTSWNDFSEQTLSAWSIYASTFNPKHVTNISLRYFNRIVLPNAVRVKDYFRTRVIFPSSLPQNVIDNFFAFTLAPVRSMRGSVSFFIDHSSPGSDDIRVVFNIIVDTPLNLELKTNAEILRTLNKLRAFKNKIFFQSITEQLKERFR